MNNVVERKHLLVLCKRTCFHVSRILVHHNRLCQADRLVGSLWSILLFYDAAIAVL